jgi:nitric oxide synthase oxygenase domain/subunit/sulfite reductase alpha subunit-like flavoprotein/hemoglobin-like flavoprotein
MNMSRFGTAELAALAGAPVVDEDLRDLLPPPLVALVKGAWSKFVTFDELMIELLFARLLSEAPELASQFGPALESASLELLRLIDVSVRALDPRTEHVLKEGYRAAPASAAARSRTRAEGLKFFVAHDVTRGQWEKVREAFLWTFGKVPHLDEMEREDLALDSGAALARFFDEAILEPVLAYAAFEADALSGPVTAEMEASAERMLARAQEAGTYFYERVFMDHPAVLQHFRTSDLDSQAHHLIAAVAFLARAARQPESLRPELRNLAAVHVNHHIPTSTYPLVAEPLMRTIEVFGGPVSDAARRGWGILLDRVVRIISEPMHAQERLVAAAREFLDGAAGELQWPQRRRDKRWSEILREIRATGTYTQTFDELEYGARVAWRNAPKCIGRISWRNLVVRDRRDVVEPRAIFEECVQHLRAASNGGNIDIILTAFAPMRPGERWGPRLWNSQLVRFAAYRQPDGSVLGDRANLPLTEAIQRLGWVPPAERTDFDVLPLVVDVPGHEPELFELDEADVLRVPLTHPDSAAFDALGLQWCAVPAIANFRLEIGGIRYGCVPFNGWFMGTEIARDLFEATRYDRAEAIAAAFGLDTSTDLTLWRDRAFLELNAAVVSSFQKARVTLVDHHTASRQFLTHEMREKRSGRECPAQWSWIVPPIGGSTTPVWHHDMRDFHLSPAFSYAADRWVVDERPSGTGSEVRPAAQVSRPLVLFASETGTAEAYARMAGRLLGSLSPRVLSMEEAAGLDLAGEAFVLIVSSTHRDGEIPTNGQAFHRLLAGLPAGALAGTRFAVLGIGNRIYAKFCAAAGAFDAALAAAGAERVIGLTQADEIAGQSDSVRTWIELASSVLGTEVRRSDPRHRCGVEIAPAQSGAEAAPPTNATVLSSEELLHCAEPGRSTREIILAIDPEDGACVPYQPGGHLAVMPVNAPDEVARVRRHLGLPAGSWFRLPDGGGQDRYREAYPVDRLLSHDLDLAFPDAPDELLTAMRDAARAAADREVLDKWIELLELENSDAARQRHKGWLRESFATLPDLLDNFPGCCPPLDVLVDIIPRLRPRLFSISSSPLVDPGRVRIIVGNLQFRCAGGIHRGVASRYLGTLVPGSRVSVAVKPAHRQLSCDLDGPLLLIGAGTGLSQLFGVLEDRAARGLRSRPDAPVHLFFGCRDEAEFLMRDQLLAWRSEGVLERVTVALSRQNPVKAYVQDALEACAREVFDLLETTGAHVMVCGDARMASEVADRILQILQREGGVSYTDAMRRLRDLRESGRYLEDVWGVQLNRSLALQEVARERYDQGSGWIRRLGRKLGATQSTTAAIRRY